MNRLAKKTGILLFVLYAFFFASTTLFVHSHDVAGARIVHSHLFGGKAHNHTSNELQTLDLLFSETYIVSNSALVPDFIHILFKDVSVRSVLHDVITEIIDTSGLRAPPSLSVL